ncbi:MAG: glutathione synthase [Myxococcota bacterium]|jgi:glutathione synthase
MRPWLVLINGVDTLSASQSTADMLQRISARGQRVGVVGLRDLETRADGSFRAIARWLPIGLSTSEEVVQAARSAEAEHCDTSDVGLVVVRLNPGRGSEAEQQLVLDQLVLMAETGVPILNEPRGLALGRTKLYLSRLPVDTRPPTLVTRNADSGRQFIQSLGGRCVVKPVTGTRGRDVFMVRDAQDPNLNQIFDVIFRQGFAMIQGFVPEASAGDSRVLLLNGRLIEQNGAIAAVRRVPTGSDFRSNVHVGGVPTPATATPALRDLVERVGPQLREDGLFLVGLDVIGTVVVEANVFSPGGFADASMFGHTDFLTPVIDALFDASRP